MGNGARGSGYGYSVLPSSPPLSQQRRQRYPTREGDLERQEGIEEDVAGRDVSWSRRVCVKPVKASLMVFHVALGVLGSLLVGWASVLWWQWHRTGLKPDAPEAAVMASDCSASASASAVMAASGGGDSPWPWSIYVMGMFGGGMVVVALSGHVAVKKDMRRGVYATIWLLIGLMVAEILCMLLIWTNNPWKEWLPGDPSGWWDLFSQYLETHERLAKLASLTLLCVECLALFLSMWLHSVYQSEYEEWLDGVEERRERTRRILDRAAEESYARGAASGWNARARDKYGMVSSKLLENTDAIHQTAQLMENE